MTINHWLRTATDTLADSLFTSAQLDAEIILAHTLNKPRIWLHAHANDSLGERHAEIANARLDLRLDHVPVAYIIGHKEFYGRPFAVSPSVLIPRPESEAMIELLGDLLPTLTAPQQLVDVGTGSGCLGITAKLEYPVLTVTLCDVDKYALAVAKKNAVKYDADVTILQSDLLQSYPFAPDIILANLPYVDSEWDTPPELQHEPEVALYAKKHGLALIESLVEQAEQRLADGGLLLLEADARQHQAIIAHAKSHNFTHTATRGLILALTR